LQLPSKVTAGACLSVSLAVPAPRERNRLRGGQEQSARGKMDPPAQLGCVWHLGTGRCCRAGAELRAAGRDAAGSPRRHSPAPFVSRQRVPPAGVPGCSLRCGHLRRHPRYRCRPTAGVSRGVCGALAVLSAVPWRGFAAGGPKPKAGGTERPRSLAPLVRAAGSAGITRGSAGRPRLLAWQGGTCEMPDLASPVGPHRGTWQCPQHPKLVPGS